MIELNSFQKKCKEKLIDTLEPMGIKIRDMKIKEAAEKWFAEKEVFIEASVGDLKIWIYEDGAHIQGININIPFESPDYNTEEGLIHAFVGEIVSLLGQQ